MLHKNDKNKSDQVQMVSVEELVPKDHILRKIDKYIDFNFIYDLVEDKYSKTTGRPSVDPVVLMKLIILQYFFNIKSMRQTIKEVEVNIAYRWFLGLDFYDKVPHFSTFGKNYERRFKDTDIFNQIFTNILEQAISYGFVDTKIQFIDSTHVKAHANGHKVKKVKIERKAKSYQKKLEKEVNEDRNNNDKDDIDFDNTTKIETQEISQSTTDPGNLHDSTTFNSFFEQEIEKYKPEKIVMDAGYKIPYIAKKLIETGIMPVFQYTKQKTPPLFPTVFIALVI